MAGKCIKKNCLLCIRTNTLVECDQCQFKCLRKCDLAKHKRKEHMEIMKSPYKCDLCGFSAKTQKLIDQHKLLHVLPDNVELFECSKCNYKTLKSSFMKRHLIRHENENRDGTKRLKISNRASMSFLSNYFIFTSIKIQRLVSNST